MSKLKKTLSSVYIVILVIAMMASLSAATYAWFSGNRTVDTDRIVVRTGSDNIELLVSSKGGNEFLSGTENGSGGAANGGSSAELVQINHSDLAFLMPVSTVDLKTFLYNDHTVDDMANDFSVLSDEQYIYHGRIFLKAAAGMDISANSKLLLYFDESERAGGILASANDEKMLKAARLGLIINNDTNNPMIFKLRPNDPTDPDRVYNTVVNGVILGDNDILVYEDGKITAGKDPSVLYTDYEVEFSSAGARLPEKPLMTMEFNQIYQMDVFFYLEGCDPDCTDQVQFDVADLHLAFYGILSE